METIEQKFTNLVRIITRLRQPDGCPWDQKQTPQSFKSYVIEETHELLEAINADLPHHVCEELGDLLFQIIFINNLYEENDHFTLADVIDHIAAKMIRRHPHVFGDQQIESEQELKAQWQKIKNAENGKSDKEKRLFDSIPKSLPALRRAQKIAGRAARTGFDWPDRAGAINKFKEESDEFEKALQGNDKEELTEELGDLLFSLTVLAKKSEIDAEEALRLATEKFTNRFYTLENNLSEQNKEIAQCSIEELLSAWQKAKAAKNV